MKNLYVKVERRGCVCILAVSGELEAASAAEFARFVKDAMAVGRPRRIIIDLSALRFIDCDGSRRLADIVRSASGRCPVVVRSLRPPVRRVLNLMCVDLDMIGPNLDLIVLDAERVRGSAEALTGSMTGMLVQRSRVARSRSEQTIADTRHTAHVIAATEDKIAANLARLAIRRPQEADRLAALSKAANAQALRMRNHARRALAV